MKTTVFLLFLALVTSAAAWGADNKSGLQTYALQSARHRGDLDRVQVLLEVGGELKFKPGVQKAEPVKMTVAARLAYHEKLIQRASRQDRVTRAIRYYEDATAELKIGDKEFRPALRQQRRLVAVSVDRGGPVLFSPAGSLMREEVDLIDVPGCSALVDQLLPDRAVAPGDRWKHEDQLMAGLLGLEEVRQNSAQTVLDSVVDGIARMQLSGHVEGVVDGAATQIELKGKYHFDTQTKRIIWFGLLIKENREPGDVASGLDVVARLQMQIATLEQSEQLTEAKLQGLSLEPTPQRTQLIHRSADPAWHMTHDRSWYLTADDPVLVIFQLLDQGQRIAQCNISPRARGKGVTLEQFQDQIRSSLDKHFGQFVEAGESINPSQCHVLRVVVRGEVSDLPIQWYYYLVSNDQGRQVVFTFTVANESISRFDAADQKLVRTFGFD
jgi:hypothetical protein